jgi:DNA invertase Pin-like site-specific DNA recombinase
MLDQIRPGDIIVVCKLDRLARSTRDLHEATIYRLAAAS